MIDKRSMLGATCFQDFTAVDLSGISAYMELNPKPSPGGPSGKRGLHNNILNYRIS